MGKRADFNTTVSAEIASKEKANLLGVHLDKYAQNFSVGKQQFSNLDLARKRAEHIRVKAIENLDKYLLEFESNIGRGGAKVLWAPEKEDALKEVEEILNSHKIKQVVKTKSSVAGEIGLRKNLEQKGFEVTETDVADAILKATDDKPSHVIIPALHKSHADIAPSFLGDNAEGENQTISDTVEKIALNVHGKYFQAKAAITGCNFLIADPGSVALTENEGNILFSSGVPDVHIVIASIDKIIPTITDLETLWPLLATYGSGQKITSYNTIVNGPRKGKENDGPKELYIILVDNWRSEVLAKNQQRKALTCIKCGACANICPVFKTIGGQVYGLPNPSPIGAVTAQHTHGRAEYKHLSEASTLCGKCDNVCPVNIDIHNLLIENRNENREAENKGFFDNYTWKAIRGAMLNRKKMNRGETFKNLIIKSSYKKDWGESREFPSTAKKSFNQLWREQNNE
jgi:L-lactate dehydrogenase complex protein LldF